MLLTSTFTPHPCLRNPHLQTIVASRLRCVKPPVIERERLGLPDGDFVDVAWQRAGNGPWVCVFHGLEGNLDSSYAAGLLSALKANGYRAVFMHFRGCSGEPNRLPHSYHSGQTGDIRHLIRLVSTRFPGDPVYAVGYSLGANALLKYVAEDGTDCPLSLAVAVSPPLVLAQAAARMNRGLSRVYQRVLVRQMQKAIVAKRARYPAMDLPSDVRQLRTFFDFDNRVTAPLNGFRDVHDYYEQASSRPVLHAIRRPTHIIFARDDPFFTPACIPTAEELSAQVVFELSDHGGHVGFIATGPRGGLRYWLDDRIAALLNTARRSA